MSTRTTTRTTTRTSSRTTARTAQPAAGTARAYGEAVLVRGGPSGGPSGKSPGHPPADEPQPPSQFLWQGRLYVIRRVLAHWYEREAWWAQGPALSRRPGSPKSLRDLAADREIWRVEASSGRQSGSGVYDLCRLPVGSAEPDRSGDATEDRAWRLLRVTD